VAEVEEDTLTTVVLAVLEAVVMVEQFQAQDKQAAQTLEVEVVLVQ
jgi:hypothetical protein